MIQTKEIIYRDDSTIQVSVFAATNTKADLLILFPAMGVRATFYKHLAAQFAKEDIHVVTVDWRGHGGSSIRPSRKVNFGYEDKVQDIRETVEQVAKWFPESKKYLIGHSLGGQIGSLFVARYPKMVQGIILVTSCSVYYKGWDGWGATKVKIAGRIFYPISKILGYFPGNIIGFGGKEARTTMRDWSKNALSGKYEITHSNFNYEKALSQSETNILAVSIDGDNLAPKRSVENLFQKFSSSSSTTHLHLTKNEIGELSNHHFKWAKEPNYIVGVIKDWLTE